MPGPATWGRAPALSCLWRVVSWVGCQDGAPGRRGLRRHPCCRRRKHRSRSNAVQGECHTQYRVTGKSVAVRRPAWNHTNVVAKPDSPVVRTLKRGAVVRSCTTMIARTASGPAYTKCGKSGSVWRMVKGGQVPATCLKKVS